MAFYEDIEDKAIYFARQIIDDCYHDEDDGYTKLDSLVKSLYWMCDYYVQNCDLRWAEEPQKSDTDYRIKLVNRKLLMCFFEHFIQNNNDHDIEFLKAYVKFSEHIRKIIGSEINHLDNADIFDAIKYPKYRSFLRDLIN